MVCSGKVAGYRYRHTNWWYLATSGERGVQLSSWAPSVSTRRPACEMAPPDSWTSLAKSQAAGEVRVEKQR